MLRIDARRPASWLALAAALVVGWELAGGERPAATAAAVAAGGLLAIAAIGRLPVAAGGRGSWRELPLLRSGWPIAGFLLGALLAGRTPGPVSCMFAASAAVAAMVFAAPAGGGRPQPSAASRALAMAGGAAATALATALVGGGPWPQSLAAATAWGLMAAGGLSDRPWAAHEWLAATGVSPPERQAEMVPGIAMACSLAAMVGCFFLAPRFAWVYPVLAVGWFVCLAVPAATADAAGPAGRRLARAAVGCPPLPGSFARAVRIALRWCGILGWPVVVAALLPAAEGRREQSPLIALAPLLVAAVVLVAAVAWFARHGRGETARALVLLLAALAAALGSRATGLAGSPSLPVFRGASVSTRGGIGVEPRGISCETPQPSQSSPASLARGPRVEIRASLSR